MATAANSRVAGEAGRENDKRPRILAAAQEVFQPHTALLSGRHLLSRLAAQQGGQR